MTKMFVEQPRLHRVMFHFIISYVRSTFTKKMYNVHHSPRIIKHLTGEGFSICELILGEPPTLHCKWPSDGIVQLDLEGASNNTFVSHLYRDGKNADVFANFPHLCYILMYMLKLVCFSFKLFVYFLFFLLRNFFLCICSATHLVLSMSVPVLLVIERCTGLRNSSILPIYLYKTWCFTKPCLFLWFLIG